MTNVIFLPTAEVALQTWDPTPMIRWRNRPSHTGVERVLEQLHVVKDYNRDGRVTDIRQEWRAVPTEDGA